MTLDQLLETAPTEEGIYVSHLHHHLLTLQDAKLDQVMKQVVHSTSASSPAVPFTLKEISTMQITLTLPDNLPLSQIQQQIQSLLNDHWQFEWRPSPTSILDTAIDLHDPWCNPDIDLPCVDTGIADLAVHHDYYLYGTLPQT